MGSVLPQCIVGPANGSLQPSVSNYWNHASGSFQLWSNCLNREWIVATTVKRPLHGAL